MPFQDEELEPRYRMPLSFGRAPGPRNLPADQRHRRYDKDLVSYTISARTDPHLLANFLPGGLAADGEPRLEICIMSFRNIGWLAGRGYDIIMVRIPAHWTENHEECSGYYVPVVWENMADPIITGREELGWPKIFAQISAPGLSAEPAQGSASWGGHLFFEFAASSFSKASLGPRPLPMVFEKYVPCTGNPEAPDAHYLTVTMPDGSEPEVLSIEAGEGHFKFYGASWEEMPTQYPIVNALASLPLSDFSSAIRIASSSGGDGSGQRRLTLRD